PDESAPERYTRLVHRLNTWLTTTTSAGRLYDTDLRLRPDGASGLVVSSFDAFRHYQREQAWTWEHQALTRARFIAGDAALGAALGLVPPTLAATVADAYREYRRRQHQIRLQGAPSARVDAAPQSAARAAVAKLWTRVFGAFWQAGFS